MNRLLVQCQPSSTVLISFPDLKRLIELLHEGQNIAIILCLLRKGHSKFSVIFKFSIMEPGFSKVSGDCKNTQTFFERKWKEWKHMPHCLLCRSLMTNSFVCSRGRTRAPNIWIVFSVSFCDSLVSYFNYLVKGFLTWLRALFTSHGIDFLSKLSDKTCIKIAFAIIWCVLSQRQLITQERYDHF